VSPGLLGDRRRYLPVVMESSTMPCSRRRSSRARWGATV
jgi:hypothetical protein